MEVVAMHRAVLSCWVLCCIGHVHAAEMPWIAIAKDMKGFVLEPTGKKFTPWGFNYDRDHRGRLLEDYWQDEWPTVETHFGQMKKLGANVVRVHLQLGKFMDEPDKPSAKALDRLAKLLRLAETVGLYLDLTGLGCYHKKDVPGWYDKLSVKDRWDVQARFWQAVAGRCKDSPAVFCYDLMNEPVVPAARGRIGWGLPSPESISSSSSRWTRQIDPGPTSPVSGCAT
jgi:aryl-phospho-beta-D-glucosidase BglC (GH1 family)